jgi:hypothetical protein
VTSFFPSSVPTGAAILTTLALTIASCCLAFIYGYAVGTEDERDARTRRAIDRFAADLKASASYPPVVLPLGASPFTPFSNDLHRARFATVSDLMPRVVEEAE